MDYVRQLDGRPAAAPPRGFAPWASTAGLDGSPGAENGITQDPEGDGLFNLFEFAFGLNPLARDRAQLQGDTPTAGMPTVTPSSGANPAKARFVRRRSFAADGINYRIAFSADLETWEPAPTPARILANIDSDYDLVEIDFPNTPEYEEKAFARVTVFLD